MRSTRWLWPVAACLMWAGGCAHGDYTSPERYERGLVVCLSGSGRMMNEIRSVRRGLAEGGVDCAIEAFEWSRFMLDLTSVEKKKTLASRLARRIETYQKVYPGRPVHLVGVSSGAGLVVWALENLTPGHRVASAVFIASSLSRTYDLTAALGRLDGFAYNFHSPMDVVSGASVVVRTVDGRHGVAAGLSGFVLPEGADEQTRAAYNEKLVQVGWTPGDAMTGNVGDHLGATRPAYVRKHIAPLVRSDHDDAGHGPLTSGAPSIDRPAAAEYGGGRRDSTLPLKTKQNARSQR
jgi:pimeloyl-ACP methyl ester carboxylesterase